MRNEREFLRIAAPYFIGFLLVFGFLAVARATAQEPTAQPTISEVTRLRAANAALSRELAVRHFLEAKANLEKAMTDAKAEYERQEKALAYATATAFKEANLSPDKFDFDPVNGTFTEKPTAAEAPVVKKP